MLQSITVLRNSFTTASLVPSTPTLTPPSTNKTNANFANKLSIRFRFRFQVRASLEPIRRNFSVDRAEIAGKKSDVVLNSLRVLEWDRLCDVVSSFARTSLGSEATKEQLWSLDQTYEESLELLRETNAAVEIYKYNNVILDLTGIDVLLVRSAIHNAQRGLPVTAKEAFSVAAVLQFADTLQTSIKAAIRENADMHSRFMPLAEMILHWVVNGTLTQMIRQIIDEDGSVKDSASPTLRQARQRVQELERRLYQLLSSLVGELSSSMEISNIDGRWCIRSAENQPTVADGLLLSSGSDVGSIVEPLSAVSLNDELQQAKTLVIDAEIEMLMQLTSKMQMDLDNIWNILKDVIFLDVVNARASFGLSFGGTCPQLLPPEYNVGASPEGNPSESNASGHSNITKKEWNLCLPKAYHPLLLEQHRQNLKKAKTDVAYAKSEIRRRRLYEGTLSWKEGKEDLPMLESKVAEIEDACPIPVDVFIEKKTRIFLITGPNTGGKTICLKTVGLAAMMAKSGLYILCAEPARIPWVDSVFTDIGDEQSLSQSLSTFSGHLKQISDIQAKSSSQSLVLLDEIGAGTNPLEGAALGMSILESFAEAGALLTIATTHHGELKTLKYSNDAFENACMEFDEANLRPTYKILWGIPGRSNAINIAGRLGLLQSIIGDARELYGTASSEIDEVIFEMEQYKQDVQRYVQEAKHYLMLSKDLHEKLLISQSKLLQHTSNLRYRKMRQVSELASAARSLLHKKMQQHRATARRMASQTSGAVNCSEADASNQEPMIDDQQKGTEVKGITVASRNSFPAEDLENAFSEPTTCSTPKVGDLVFVQSLGMKATLLEVEPSKNAVVVQVGNLKMKLKITDLKS